MKRRYKLLLVIFISFLLIFFIYKLLYKPKKFYLAIKETTVFTYNYSDYVLNNYHNYSSKILNYDYLTVDNLIEDINKNYQNINYYFNKVDIITLDFGISELNNYTELNNEIVINYLNDVYDLLNILNKRTKGKVFLIMYYNDEFISKKIKGYCEKFDIKFIDYKQLEDNILKLNNRYIIDNYGHKKIFDFISTNIIDK